MRPVIGARMRVKARLTSAAFSAPRWATTAALACAAAASALSASCLLTPLTATSSR